MRRWVFLGLAVALGAAGAFGYRELFYRPPLPDPDCPATAPVFVATIPHDVRMYDIGSVDPESGKRRRLSDDHASWDPDVSPDGKHIAFVSGRDGGWEESSAYLTSSLYMMDVDGGNQHRLVPGKQFDDPTWSPDGKQIAFVYGGSEGTGVIHVVNLNEKLEFNSQAVISFHADIRQLDWSPSEDTLLFDAVGSQPTTGIYTLELGSGDPDLAFPNGRSPAWSPDGSRIAYFSGGREGPFQLTVTDPSGRRRTDIRPEFEFDTALEDISWTRC